MAEAFKVTVKGIDLLTVKLIKFADDVKTLNGFDKSIGQKIISDASAIVAKKTGALAASLGYSKLTNGIQVYAGNQSVPYAGTIEFGWAPKGKPEKPFLRPAVYNNIDSIIKKYEDGINQTIEKYNLN